MTARRRFFAALIVSVLAATVTGAAADHSARQRTGYVKILILSKHIRSLPEGREGALKIECRNCELRAGSRRFSVNGIDILRAVGSYAIGSGGEIFKRGELTLYPESPDSTFTVGINGAARRYPLPLYIKNIDSVPEFSIEEDIGTYAIDSAHSELGAISGGQSEALYALAHIIKARCTIPHVKGKHAGYDFCDLTCCQSYSGRSGVDFNEPVSVKTENSGRGFFFHSSSGGRLMPESVFGGGETVPPPRDVIYSENFILSSANFNQWSASISADELSKILYPERDIKVISVLYDILKCRVAIVSSVGEERFPSETFRLKVNRVRGWNFIKSNNYTVTAGGKSFIFKGSGLGHGAGMSLEGALKLAEKGYSRYEILEHYFPGIEYAGSGLAADFKLQYIVFDPESGEVVKTTNPSFHKRVIPCGSVFKLFIALYLSERRVDLFHNHKYLCAGTSKEKFMPETCWERHGHGKVDIRSALYNSCNLYFASLCSSIDQRDFRDWISRFTEREGIELILPASKSRAEFSNLLAGLNFGATITIDGLIKLNRYITLTARGKRSAEFEDIFSALHKTFTDGTAVETHRTGGGEKDNVKFKSISGLWGKTGTVIAGTNSHRGYGIFIGGGADTGIVSVLMNGTGAKAAIESEKILKIILTK